ncbi:hypothetical protein D8X91_01500 [Listeria seeligeri]|nr:hypothetical protein [Listeria seeligeri]
MIGKLSKNALNQQKFRRISHRFYCQFSKILPKATKLSLFWCFLPQFSTKEKTDVTIDATAFFLCCKQEISLWVLKFRLAG